VTQKTTPRAQAPAVCEETFSTYFVPQPVENTTYITVHYYVVCVCSRYSLCSDWLIVGHYSPVMPTGQLQARKTKAKSHIINNLLTLNFQSLQENLKPQPCCIDLAIARSIQQGLGLRFSSKDLTLG